MAELILTGDTLNEGRIKINQAYTGQTVFWSASTGVSSIIMNNGSGNYTAGKHSIVVGFGHSGSTTYGNYSTIAGGQYNHNKGNLSFIGAGGGYNSNSKMSNYISANVSRSFIGAGGYNKIKGGVNNAIVAGGGYDYQFFTFLNRENVISGGTRNFIGAGKLNSIATGSESATIVAGTGNKIFAGDRHFIGAGYNNNISTYNELFENNSVIVGGYANKIKETQCFIGGGGANHVYGSYSSIVGGGGNVVATVSDYCFIGGGYVNRISTNSDYNVVVGGKYNHIYAGDHSFMGGGYKNYLFANRAVLVGGRYNYVGGDNAVIVGGRGNKMTHNFNFGIGGGGLSIATSEVVMAGTDTDTPSAANNTIRFDMVGGNGRWDGTVNLGAADYAEYFEWEDGNTNNEDRRGYFVSIIGNKIKIGNENIIGIVSANPAVVGDASPNKWNGAFELDEWGTPIYSEYSYYKIIEKEGETGETTTFIYVDDNDNEFLEYHSPSNVNGIPFIGDSTNSTLIDTRKVRKLNPSFNPSTPYIAREDRSEWDPIGILGKLMVRTSENITGSRVDVNASGMAINGTAYHVLKTEKPYDGSYGIVQILLR